MAQMPTSPSRLPSHEPGASNIPDWLGNAEWCALVDAMNLTPREADILACALLNDRTASTARTLGIAEATVHTYRDRLFRKLRTTSMTGVISIAFETFVRDHRRM